MNTHLIELCKRALTGLVLIISFGGAYLHSSSLFIVALAVLLHITLYWEWPKLVNLEKKSRYVFTIVYPIAPFIVLIGLTHHFYNTDFYLPIFPFLTAWAADTGGYIVGKLIGFHKMCPTISPGKSWEGFIGSIISVWAMCWHVIPKIVLLRSTILATNQFALFLFALLITTIAFLGGFFLSILKRKEGLKDAGSLLPGHGGILDRFDGVLFVGVTTAVVALLCQ